jgi:5-methylcytosine-specific restriction endonuclease McrA
MAKPNPRSSNGAARRKIRARVLAVYDHCALCGLPVDKTLKTPHPMSAEVDEIVPVSKGGSPIEWGNVQLAHRICNLRKGNGRHKKRTGSLPLPISRRW